MGAHAASSGWLGLRSSLARSCRRRVAGVELVVQQLRRSARRGPWAGTARPARTATPITRVQVSRKVFDSDRAPCMPVTSTAPTTGSEQALAAADRAPDHYRQAERHVEEGRRRELHHDRVEHAGETGDRRRDAHHEDLVARDVVAEIAARGLPGRGSPGGSGRFAAREREREQQDNTGRQSATR